MTNVLDFHSIQSCHIDIHLSINALISGAHLEAQGVVPQRDAGAVLVGVGERRPRVHVPEHRVLHVIS